MKSLWSPYAILMGVNEISMGTLWDPYGKPMSSICNTYDLCNPYGKHMRSALGIWEYGDLSIWVSVSSLYDHGLSLSLYIYMYGNTIFICMLS